MGSLTRRLRRPPIRPRQRADAVEPLRPIAAKKATAHARRTAPQPILVEPPRPFEHRLHMDAIGRLFAGALTVPSGLAAIVQLAIDHEESELHRVHVESFGGILLNGVAFEGPRRFSENDDIELMCRRLEEDLRTRALVADRIAGGLASPPAKTWLELLGIQIEASMIDARSQWGDR